jgi:hypothetical protein
MIMARFDSKRQLENQPVPVDQNRGYVDEFGNEINVGDFVIFTRKSYSMDALTGAKVSFGKVIKRYPSGGFLIKDIRGDEVKLLKLFEGIMVKFTDDLKSRVMLAKLSA